MPKFLPSFSLQELNSRLDRAAQEKNDLLSNLSSLEEKISSAENESNVLQGKLTSLMEEKAGIEKEMTLLRETLQTAEKEKQVCDSKNFAKVMLYTEDPRETTCIVLKCGKICSCIRGSY